MGQKNLHQIWKEITGNTSLIIAPGYRWEKIRTGPQFSVYWTYSELAPTSDNLKNKYIETLSKVEPIALLKTLAVINNTLITEKAIDPLLHRDLESQLLRKDLLDAAVNPQVEDVKEKPDLRPVFHRSGLLLNMKLALGLSGTYQPKEDVFKDPHFIGDLCLFANEFLREETESEEMNNEEFILEFVANWDTNNFRDIAYSMSRYDKLIRDYLTSDDEQVVKAREKLSLTTERFDGLLIDEYLSLVFGIYSKTLSEMKKKRGCVIFANAISESLGIPPASVQTFFDRRATSLTAFRKTWASGGWEETELTSLIGTDRFATDITPFRHTPFLKLDEDSFLVLDLRLVIELLITGLYWRIFDGLPGNQRTQLTSLWGRLFELYTVGLFQNFYPPSTLTHTIFDADKNYTYSGGSGQIDALLDYGHEVIIFEAKASLLSLDARCNRDWDKFEAEVKLKFIENEKGDPKALVQLAREAEAIFEGAVFNPIPTTIFPVLITDEKSLESFGMNKYLNQQFQSLLPQDLVNKVRPLTVISIDELEEILPYISEAKLTWNQLLNERFIGEDVSIYSVRQALYDTRKKNSIPSIRNEHLLQRFEEVFSRVKSRLEPAKEA